MMAAPVQTRRRTARGRRTYIQAAVNRLRLDAIPAPWRLPEHEVAPERAAPTATSCPGG